MKPLEERFWPKVRPAGADECWLWDASLNDAGYGQIFVKTGEAPRRAHRIAWELLRGEIPAGLQLDHLCRVRHCVNPWHLDPVTNEVNTARGDLREYRPPRKSHCPSGHPYDDANTYVKPNGERCCRQCARDRSLRGHHRRARDAAEARLGITSVGEHVDVITDHRHTQTKRGRWVTPECGICGEHSNRHLTYGQDIAAKVGGDPMDYVVRRPGA